MTYKVCLGRRSSSSIGLFTARGSDNVLSVSQANLQFSSNRKTIQVIDSGGFAWTSEVQDETIPQGPFPSLLVGDVTNAMPGGDPAHDPQLLGLLRVIGWERINPSTVRFYGQVGMGLLYVRYAVLGFSFGA